MRIAGYPCPNARGGILLLAPVDLKKGIESVAVCEGGDNFVSPWIGMPYSPLPGNTTQVFVPDLPQSDRHEAMPPSMVKIVPDR